MRRESWEIFGACALGAFIGSLIAIRLSAIWLGLPIGMFLGGMVGYLSYRFEDVLTACKRASHWRPDWRRFGMRIAYALLFCLFLSVQLTLFLPTIFCWRVYPHADPTGWLVIPLLLLSVPFFVLMWISDRTRSYEDTIPVLKDELIVSAYGRWCLKYLNIVAVTFWISYGMIRLIIYIVIRTPRAIATASVSVAKFIRDAFLYIHSRERLLVFTDAAIGAGIGWSFQNPIIGALLGGVLGVLNFEILSVRILKLAPSRIRR